jgi:ubiquinol-cytochrome c reductase cytochrome c1 subunit|tara:strand:+ start:327 stop:1118 length:792 start_codon:yes stop_codon:yes gene_type:complete
LINKVKNFIKLITIISVICFTTAQTNSAENVKYLKTDWSFKGLFGKFDRGSLQRGYQVYTEVCASCHSMKYLSYRNLGESGGPEFSEAEVKAIAASFEVTDGPNADGEMFQRPAKLSDKFVMPYENVKAAQAANGGAYPPDMSVLVKARGGGVDYIYSLLQGYEDVPAGMTLDDGVHYNKYMYGNKIKMAAPLSDGIVEYGDGTKATVEQMSKDVTTFLMWAAEPHLEARHQMGFKAIVYLIILTILVYFSMKKIWSRVETEV